jgi:hypothetical protein
MSFWSPLQWKGSVWATVPFREGVRRAPSPTNFHVRPSSPPSPWHDAHATNAPALEWKTACPVSSRLSVASSIVWRTRRRSSVMT